MDLMAIGAQLLAQKMGGNVSSDNAQSALSGLIGDGKGGLDLGSIVSKMSSGGALSGLVGSWLGDGENAGIDASQIMDIFGGDKISSFAQNLGVDQDQATTGLADVLPQIMDKGSSGGNLLDSVGGLGGLAGLAKKFF